MASNRDRLACSPVGSTKELTWSLPRDWHHTRRQYDFLAELGRADGAPSGWLCRSKHGGPLVEIAVAVNGYKLVSVPQHKAEAALAAMSVGNDA